MVAIKDMEMPKSCYECDIDTGECPIEKYQLWLIDYQDKRHKECLLVEIEDRKVGYWIPVYQGDEIIDYRCSNCDFGSTFGKGTYGMNYCNNCGSHNKNIIENGRVYKGND